MLNVWVCGIYATNMAVWQLWTTSVIRTVSVLLRNDRVVRVTLSDYSKEVETAKPLITKRVLLDHGSNT